MLVGWALLPVSEFETTNSDGQECPSYVSSTIQVLLRGHLVIPNSALTYPDCLVVKAMPSQTASICAGSMVFFGCGATAPGRTLSGAQRIISCSQSRRIRPNRLLSQGRLIQVVSEVTKVALWSRISGAVEIFLPWISCGGTAVEGRFGPVLKTPSGMIACCRLSEGGPYETHGTWEIVWGPIAGIAITLVG